MRNLISLITLCFFLSAPWSSTTLAQQETIEESSTGKVFPREISFSYNDVDYTLAATGTAVRKKFVFKVYGMVHYMENPSTGNKEEIFNAVLSNNSAKQLTLDFARDVGEDKIKDAFQDGFNKNATKEELQDIRQLVNEFLGYFTSEVKKNEQYVFRWLPDGTLISIVQGEEQPAIQSETFSRVLWTIWLGENSIVKRDDLIRLLIEE